MSMSSGSSRLVKKIQFQVESLSSLKRKYQVQLWVIVYDLSFLRPKFGALKQFRRGPFTFSTPVRMNRSDHPSLIKTGYFGPNCNWRNENLRNKGLRNWTSQKHRIRRHSVKVDGPEIKDFSENLEGHSQNPKIANFLRTSTSYDRPISQTVFYCDHPFLIFSFL